MSGSSLRRPVASTFWFLMSVSYLFFTIHISIFPAAYPMSEDHKPNRADERQRIEEAGGVVVWAGTWRVGGVLAGKYIVLRYHKVCQPLRSHLSSRDASHAQLA